MKTKVVKEKLPKGIKNKWVKALRSGKYEQGNGAMAYYRGNTSVYCCLGVLGSICGHPNEELRGGFPNNVTHPKFPDILKVENIEDFLEKCPLAHKLAAFNDDGKSFKWIASYIKRYL